MYCGRQTTVLKGSSTCRPVGGVVNEASHLWWGVGGSATITIGGEVRQDDGIPGTETLDASTASSVV
jgi:hypothetical protein